MGWYRQNTTVNVFLRSTNSTPQTVHIGNRLQLLHRLLHTVTTPQVTGSTDSYLPTHYKE